MASGFKVPKRFYFYVCKEILYVFLVSIFLLTFVLILGRIRKLTDLIINKGVEVQDILLVLLYTAPSSLMFTLPMAFILATIVVLGRQSAENELLTLKASGISLKCLFVPVFFYGIAIAILGLANTLVFIPKSGELLRETVVNIIKKGITVEDREGVFNDSIPGIVIYIDKVQMRDGYFSGILVSDEREKDVRQIVTAKKGIISFDPSSMNLTFVLKDGVLHRWEREKDIYRNLAFKDYNFTIDLNTILPKGRPLRKKPYEMDMGELKDRIKMEQNPSRKYELLLELYRKIFLPLSSLSFSLLAVPLGVRRRTEGKFAGVTYGLFLFVVYYLLIAFSDYAGKTLQIPAALAASLPNLCVGIIGLYLAFRLNHEEYVNFYHRMRFFSEKLHEKVRQVLNRDDDKSSPYM
ncbi:MAG: LptF/LptG family permease [Desulfobacterota bacterium]|nr:LptF/LptG family permease [Thermodesulfobacteriota bacterium]MDW8001764.1 LptF/LptG family permease [Deltaproteobacteria bacterium]